MSSDRPSGKSRRGKRRPTLGQRANTVLRELHAIGRELAQQLGLQANDLHPIDHLVLPVTVSFGSKPRRSEHAAQLVETYRNRLDEGLRAAVAFRPGRVFCFQCDSSECPHALPPDRSETFRGYAATGKPQWQSFLNFCLERGESRVDRLYAEPPEVIAIYQPANELTGELLPGFGKGSLVFNVLGQVVLVFMGGSSITRWVISIGVAVVLLMATMFAERWIIPRAQDLRERLEGWA